MTTSPSQTTTGAAHAKATTMTQTLNPPLKWHGGKTYLADRLIALFPPHIHYVEPFFGGGAVLLAKNPVGASEVVNDLNGDLINFWRVLADPVLFPMFLRTAQATPCSEELFVEAQRVGRGGEAVCRAINFLILCRQSRAATFKDFTTLAKTRTRRNMNELPSAWWNAIDGLPEVHARLSRVVILNRPAVECLRTQDGKDTLFYCDPPYMHETRSTPDVYQHEMSRQDHEEFLDACLACKGYVVISGYDCDLYRERLAKWQRYAFELPNNAAGGDSKRRMTEVVWCNYAAGGVR